MFISFGCLFKVRATVDYCVQLRSFAEEFGVLKAEVRICSRRSHPLKIWLESGFARTPRAQSHQLSFLKPRGYAWLGARAQLKACDLT